jgi:XTP/dITP diphosphohydrolase
VKFIIATTNEHKKEELAKYFKETKLALEVAPEKLDVVEDGQSFSENAFKKAKAYYDKFKTPVIADDSGLVVNALPAELGLYSARFGGEGLSDKDRAHLLLKKMEGITNRAAFFQCVLCFYLKPSEVYFFEGRLKGEIIYSYQGTGGFGYDPVFRGEGQREGETLSSNEAYKDLNSHRAEASKQAKRFFQGLLKA